MGKIITTRELEEPRFMLEGYEYIGDDGHWHIKEDAPDWAKEEFEEFYKKVNPTPDENGKIIQY